MIAWWRDVINEAQTGYHTRVVQLHLRYGMILFIASEVMFFVAWFWAYFDAALFAGDARSSTIAYQLLGGHWPPVPTADARFKSTFDPWHLPLLNTLILLTSGTTVTWAHHALLENDRKGLIQGLWLTVILGVALHLRAGLRIHPRAFTFAGHIYGSTFFMATGFHGAHVIIGTIFLSSACSAPMPATSTPTSISASRRRPGTGTSSTWSGCSCSSSSTCGARAHRPPAIEPREGR